MAGPLPPPPPMWHPGNLVIVANQVYHESTYRQEQFGTIVNVTYENTKVIMGFPDSYQYVYHTLVDGQIHKLTARGGKYHIMYRIDENGNKKRGIKQI